MLITLSDAIHFLKVVPGTKDRPLGCQNDTSDGGLLGDLVKGVLKGRHHRPRQGIAAFGVVHRQGDKAVIVCACDKLWLGCGNGHGGPPGWLYVFDVF